MPMTLWKATAVLTACFLPSMGMAHNVTVGDFGGTSTNGAFVAGTWTPTADSNLDKADFQAALNTGDVTIITNGAGNIEFQNDSGPFTFPTPPRTLLLQAEGNVSVERLSTSNVTDGPLNLVINASSAVSVATTGDGVNINGGDFNSTGTDFSCNQACVDTIGGDVLLNHSGSVSIEDGGVATDGGGFTSNGTDFSCNGSCIATSGGDITLNHTGSVSITDGGADTGGGKFTSSGTDFSCSDVCIDTDGGNAVLNHTGNVSIKTLLLLVASSSPTVLVFPAAAAVSAQAGGTSHSITPAASRLQTVASLLVVASSPPTALIFPVTAAVSILQIAPWPPTLHSITRATSRSQMAVSTPPVAALSLKQSAI